MDAQVEGVASPGVLLHQPESLVRYDVRQVARLAGQLAVAHHGCIVVGTAASLVYEPVGEAVLHYLAVAQVPLPRDAAGPAMAGHDVGVGNLTLQVWYRPRTGVAAPDPVVHAVLGGNPSR